MIWSALGLLDGPAAARDAARAILSESRFHAPGVPRPLHGTLVAIGNALRAPFNAIASLVDSLAAGFPGGVAGVWAVLAFALAFTVWLLSRRWRREFSGEPRTRPEESLERATDLERASSLAERDGRFEDAVRLRFRAGLLRLNERRRIASARTTPTVEVSRALGSPHFDLLARRFDEIAYGGSSAAEADAREARSEWARVLSSEGAPR